MCGVFVVFELVVLATTVVCLFLLLSSFLLGRLVDLDVRMRHVFVTTSTYCRCRCSYLSFFLFFKKKNSGSILSESVLVVLCSYYFSHVFLKHQEPLVKKTWPSADIISFFPCKLLVSVGCGRASGGTVGLFVIMAKIIVRPRPRA